MPDLTTIPKTEPEMLATLNQGLALVEAAATAEETYHLLIQCSALTEAAQRVDRTGRLVMAAKTLRLAAERRLAQILHAEDPEGPSRVLARLRNDYGFGPAPAGHICVFGTATDAQWASAIARAQDEHALDRYVVAAILRNIEWRKRGSNKKRDDLSPTQRFTDIARWVNWAAREAGAALSQLEENDPILDVTYTQADQLRADLGALVNFADEAQPYVTAAMTASGERIAAVQERMMVHHA